MQRFIVLFLFLQFMLSKPPLYAQVKMTEMSEKTSRIAHDYYRINPFNKDFSEFLNRLLFDPQLRDSQLSRKSDTSLFFMQGIYPAHRPFFFSAIQTRVILAERPDTEDSTKMPHSRFHYQLIGYAQPGESGTSDVKSEYEKLIRKYRKQFDMSTPRPIYKADVQTGEVRDFYFDQVPFAPFTLAWSTDEQHGNILALTIRFEVYNNRAYLPIAADGF